MTSPGTTRTNLHLHMWLASAPVPAGPDAGPPWLQTVPRPPAAASAAAASLPQCAVCSPRSSAPTLTILAAFPTNTTTSTRLRPMLLNVRVSVQPAAGRAVAVAAPEPPVDHSDDSAPAAFAAPAFVSRQLSVPAPDVQRRTLLRVASTPAEPTPLLLGSTHRDSADSALPAASAAHWTHAAPLELKPTSSGYDDDDSATTTRPPPHELFRVQLPLPSPSKPSSLSQWATGTTTTTSTSAHLHPAPNSRINVSFYLALRPEDRGQLLQHSLVLPATGPAYLLLSPSPKLLHRALLVAALSPPPPLPTTPPEAHVYCTAWEHGIVLSTLPRAATTSSEACLARLALATTLAAPRSPPDPLLVLALLGQLLALVLVRRRTALIPQVVLDCLGQVTATPAASAALAARLLNATWDSGLIHLRHQAQLALAHLVRSELQQTPLPSFRLLRLAPLLRALDVIPDAALLRANMPPNGTSAQLQLAMDALQEALDRLSHSDESPDDPQLSLHALGEARTVATHSMGQTLDILPFCSDELRSKLGELARAGVDLPAPRLHQALETVDGCLAQMLAQRMMPDMAAAARAVAEHRNLSYRRRMRRPALIRLLGANLARNMEPVVVRNLHASPSALVLPFAGYLGQGQTVDGITDTQDSPARLFRPEAVAVLAATAGGAPRIVVSQLHNHTLRMLQPGPIDARETLNTTRAANISTLVVGGPRHPINMPRGMSPHPLHPSLLAMADAGSHTILLLDLAVTPPAVHVLAGAKTGKSGHHDGSASAALFNCPSDVAWAPDGCSLYVADRMNHAIRQLSYRQEAGELTDRAAWSVATIAGVPRRSGTAHPHLTEPSFLLVVRDGAELLIAQRSIHCIATLALDTTPHQLSLLCGEPLRSGFVDRLPSGPDPARFHFPSGMALDTHTNLVLVADNGNAAVRAVDLTTGAVTTIAGGEPVPKPMRPREPTDKGAYGCSPVFVSPSDIAARGDGSFVVSDARGHVLHLLIPNWRLAMLVTDIEALCGLEGHDEEAVLAQATAAIAAARDEVQQAINVAVHGIQNMRAAIEAYASATLQQEVAALYVLATANPNPEDLHALTSALIAAAPNLALLADTLPALLALPPIADNLKGYILEPLARRLSASRTARDEHAQDEAVLGMASVASLHSILRAVCSAAAGSVAGTRRSTDSPSPLPPSPHLDVVPLLTVAIQQCRLAPCRAVFELLLHAGRAEFVVDAQTGPSTLVRAARKWFVVHAPPLGTDSDVTASGKRFFRWLRGEMSGALSSVATDPALGAILQSLVCSQLLMAVQMDYPNMLRLLCDFEHQALANAATAATAVPAFPDALPTLALEALRQACTNAPVLIDPLAVLQALVPALVAQQTPGEEDTRNHPPHFQQLAASIIQDQLLPRVFEQLESEPASALWSLATTPLARMLGGDEAVLAPWVPNMSLLAFLTAQSTDPRTWVVLDRWGRLHETELSSQAAMTLSVLRSACARQQADLETGVCTIGAVTALSQHAAAGVLATLNPELARLAAAWLDLIDSARHALGQLQVALEALAPHDTELVRVAYLLRVWDGLPVGLLTQILPPEVAACPAGCEAADQAAFAQHLAAACAMFSPTMYEQLLELSRPIPPSLAAAAPLLHSLSGSRLTKFLFAEAGGATAERELSPSPSLLRDETWASHLAAFHSQRRCLREALQTASITVAETVRLEPHGLLVEEELALLLADSSDSVAGPTQPSSASIAALAFQLTRLTLIDALHLQRESMAEKLRLAGGTFLTSPTKDTLLEAAIFKMEDVVRAVPAGWAQLSLADAAVLPSVGALISPDTDFVVPRALLHLPIRLLQQLADSMPLLAFLRTFINQADFDGAVELALGKSELATPAELWVARSDGTGAPDGQVLSQLSSLYTQLASLIGSRRVQTLEHLGELLESVLAFVASEQDAATLATDLAHCTKLLVPLSDLLSRESSATHRLMHIARDPEAVWCFTFPPAPGGSVHEAVTLKFSSARGRSRQAYTMRVDALQDFVGALSLATAGPTSVSGGGEGADTRADSDGSLSTEAFADMFSAALTNAELLGDLAKAGHPDFVAVSRSIPVRTSSGPSVSKTAASLLLSTQLQQQHPLEAWGAEMQQIQAAWQAGLQRLWHAHPLMTFFSPQQMLALLRAVVPAEGGVGQQAGDDARSTPCPDARPLDLLHCLCPRLSREAAEGLFTALCSAMADIIATPQTTAKQLFAQLERLGGALEEVCEPLAAKLRPLPLPADMGSDPCLWENCGETLGDRRVVLVPVTQSSTLPTAISELVRGNRALPSHGCMLSCARSTSADEIRRFLSRWQDNPLGTSVFVLDSAHLLGYSEQQSALKAIQHGLANSSPSSSATAVAACLVVTVLSVRGPLASQLMFGKVTRFPLPSRFLRSCLLASSDLLGNPSDTSTSQSSKPTLPTQAGRMQWAATEAEMLAALDRGGHSTPSSTSRAPFTVEFLSAQGSGLGKTFQIKLQAALHSLPYRYCTLHGARSRADIVRLLCEAVFPTSDAHAEHRSTQPPTPPGLLHLDIGQDFVDSDGVLLGFLLLGLASEPTSSAPSSMCAWWPHIAHVVVETPVASEHAAPTAHQLTGSLAALRHVLPTTTLTVAGGIAAFTMHPRLLALGMHPDNFPAVPAVLPTLGQPLSPSSKPSPLALAAERAHYVAEALATLKLLNGRFPLNFTPKPLSTSPSSSPSSSELLTLVASMSRGVLARSSYISLWGVWAFVHCFAVSLGELEHSCLQPLLASGLTRSDHAMAQPEAVKGEIVQFLLRSCVAFAARQVRDKDPGLVVAVSLHHLPKFCGRWPRASFDVALRPCFVSRVRSLQMTLYLYFNTAIGRWQIDNGEESTGRPVMLSTTSSLNSDFVMGEEWGSTRTSAAHGTGMRAEVFTAHVDDQRASGRISGPIPAEHFDLSIIADPLRHDNICSWDGMMREQRRIKRGEPPPPLPPRVHSFGWRLVTGPAHPAEQSLMASDEAAAADDDDVRRDVEAAEAAAAQGDRRDDEAEAEENEWGQTPPKEPLFLRWEDSNHDCMAFSATRTYFLGIRKAAMLAKIHPGVRDALRATDSRQVIFAGAVEESDQFSYGGLVAATEPLGDDGLGGEMDFVDVLRGITGKTHASIEAVEPGFVCSSDTLLKCIAVLARLRSGIPVVLEGECGCGKTALVRFLAKWLECPLHVLNVHGGTVEADVERVFHQAEDTLAQQSCKMVAVFLDELNCANLGGLFAEIVTRRTFNNRPISSGIMVLAAVNPYRRRVPDYSSEPAAGLLFTYTADDGDDGDNDDRAAGAKAQAALEDDLVYKVSPLPAAIRNCVFDFGVLSPEKEETIAAGMLAPARVPGTAAEKSILVAMLGAAQKFTRTQAGDASATSLRDIKRCMELAVWFRGTAFFAEQSPMDCWVLALAFVYFFRLADHRRRQQLWSSLRTTLTRRGKTQLPESLAAMAEPGGMQRVLARVQREFCEHFVLEADTVLSATLEENLFVSAVCIFTKLPLMLVGPPGSSKTLTLRVLAANLLGPQSDQAFWRAFPALKIFSYQCSPMTQASHILEQHELALKFQGGKGAAVSVLLLDEIGLAEYSPSKPLKSLHDMLSSRKVAIVGISNWSLDPAKLNRCIVLQRPIPTLSESIETAAALLLGLGDGSGSVGDAVGPDRALMRQTSLSTAESTLPSWVRGLGEAYTAILQDQQRGLLHGGMASAQRTKAGGRDFFGLLKFLRTAAASRRPFELTPEVLLEGVARNFGSSDTAATERVAATFLAACFPDPDAASNTPAIHTAVPLPATLGLIRANLHDPSCRHLLLFAQPACVAMPLLAASGLADASSVEVLWGTDFPGGKVRAETAVMRMLTATKAAMKEGRTLVLIQARQAYESLFDILNQRVVARQTPEGTEHFLRLAIHSRSELCPVAPGFRVIVCESLDTAHELDLPFLNRFEKHVLGPRLVMDDDDRLCLRLLEEWIDEVAAELNIAHSDLTQAFAGWHPSLAALFVVTGRQSKAKTADGGDEGVGQSVSERVAALKRRLAQMGLPFAVANSPSLQAEVPDYFETCASLAAVLGAARQPVLSVLTFASSVSVEGLSVLQDEAATVLPLHQVTSEQHMRQSFAAFFARRCEPESRRPLLVITADLSKASEQLLLHAQDAACQAYANAARAVVRGGKVDMSAGQVVFLVFLTPRLRGGDAHVQVRLYPAAGIEAYFVDELGSDGGTDGASPTVSTQALLTETHEQLIASGAVPLDVKALLPSAIARCLVPKGSYGGQRRRQLQPHAGAAGAAGQDHSQAGIIDDLRLVAVQMLLNSSPEWAAQLRQSTLDVLVAQAQPAAQMQPHVRLALMQQCGTLHGSLLHALQVCAVQALASVLRTLDCNHNLALLGEALAESGLHEAEAALGRGDAELPPLVRVWLELSQHPLVLDTLKAAGRVRRAGADGVVNASELFCKNTAAVGRPLLVAAFPFSWKVVEAMQAWDLELMQVGGEHGQRPLATVVQTATASARQLFGSAVVEAWAGLGEAFLHDWAVHAGTARVALTSRMQAALARAVCRCAEADGGCEAGSVMGRPEALVAAMAYNRSRLLAMEGLVVDMTSLDPAFAGGFMDEVLAVFGRQDGGDKRSSLPQDSPSPSHLADLDRGVLAYVLHYLHTCERPLEAKQLCMVRMEASVLDLAAGLEAKTEAEGVTTTTSVWRLAWAALRCDGVLNDLALAVQAEWREATGQGAGGKEDEPGSPGGEWVPFPCFRAWAFSEFAFDPLAFVRFVAHEAEAIVKLGPGEAGPSCGQRRYERALEDVFGVLRRFGLVTSAALAEFMALVVAGQATLATNNPEAVSSLDHRVFFAASWPEEHFPQLVDKVLAAARDPSVLTVLLRAAECHVHALTGSSDAAAAAAAHAARELLVQLPSDRHSGCMAENWRGLQAQQCWALAAVQRRLWAFARDLAALAATDWTVATQKELVRKHADVWQLLSPRVAGVKTQEEAAYFLLKALRFEGGVSVLAAVLASGLQAEWLPFEPAANWAASSAVVDPCRWECATEAYDRLCRRISTVATGGGAGSGSGSDAWGDAEELAAGITERPHTSHFARVLVGAAASQVFLLGESGREARTRAAAFLERQPALRSNTSFGRIVHWLERGAPLMAEGHSSAGEDDQSLHFGDEEIPAAQRVTAHLLLMALEKPASLLGTMLLRPSELEGLYLPSMPDDPMAAIVATLGGVGWYKCANGHAFAVGNCTWPMEMSTCPTCHAPIGGEHHTPVEGNVRVTADELLGGAETSRTGYFASATLGEAASTYDSETMTGGGGPQGTRIWRLVMHLTLLGTAQTSDSAEVLGSLAQMLETDVAGVARALRLRVRQDWEAVRAVGGGVLSNEQVGTLMHSILRDCGRASAQFSLDAQVFLTRHGRMAFEDRFQRICLVPLKAGSLAVFLEQTVASNTGVSEIQAVFNAMGEARWQRLQELGESEGDGTRVSSLLWQLRPDVGLARLVEALRTEVGSGDAAKRLPLLAHLYLRGHSRELALCAGIADILRWHSVLMEVFPARSLTSSEAATITNAEAVARLPAHRREEGAQALAAYCAVFNRSFGLVGNLHECQANPFLADNGAIDLSGLRRAEGGDAMGEDTPVAFSLPHVAAGATNAMGLCTVRLLTTLAEEQNAALAAVEAAAAKRQREAGATTRGAAAVEGEAVPATAFHTPATVVQRRLVAFCEERDVLPLLAMFRSSRGAGNAKLCFDFERIEATLVQTVLGGKPRIQLQIPHFQYRGEIQQCGFLSQLAARVKQQPFPPLLLRDVVAELETPHAARELTGVLEAAIFALVGVGRVVQTSPQALLDAVVDGLLPMPASVWAAASTPTLRRHGRLCHLQSLYLELEEQLSGGWEKALPARFKAPLPADLEEAVLAGRRLWPVEAVLVPLLHDFMTEHLCGDEVALKPAECLKEMLEYAAVDAIEDEEWFAEGFPDSLTLAHIWALYSLLTGGGKSS